MATLNPNQRAQTKVKGDFDLAIQPNVIAVVVKSDEATDLVAGQAVNLVDEDSRIPTITAATRTGNIFGFVARNLRVSDFAKGESCEIAFSRGTVLYLEAAAAVAKGALLEYVPTGQKVQTAASGGRVIGHALDKAAADGDLIRVVIDLPGDLLA